MTSCKFTSGSISRKNSMLTVNISLFLVIIATMALSVNGLIMLASIMLVSYLPKYLVFRANDPIKSANISFFSDCNVLDKVEY